MISSVMPGIEAILAPFSEAFLLASVWDKDFEVGIRITSEFCISFATSFGGSWPLNFGLGISVRFAYFVIFSASFRREFAMVRLFLSYMIRTRSFSCVFMQVLSAIDDACESCILICLYNRYKTFSKA